MTVSDLAYIDDTGYHFADYPSFLAFVQGVWQGVYGSDIYLGADSQDGQLTAILAQAFYDTAALGASTYNSFSPVSAQGVGLSRVVKINGLDREVPSYSTVTLTIGGTAGTVITNGIAQDTVGQNWVLPSTVTIPGGGSIDVTATAQSIGQVFAEANTITAIFTPTNGWQTVNNASPADAGASVESDAALRIRQQESTGLPAQTVLDATAAAVANVAGVSQVVPYENDGESTDGNGLPAHSICIIVAGSPVESDVIRAIQIKKTPGTDTYGNVSELVYDSEGMPLTIKYQQAVGAEIQVTVNLTRGQNWSDDYVALIQTAVANYINSIPIGGANRSKTIYYTTMFPPAYLNGQPQGQTYDITSLTMGKNGGGQSAANVSLDFDEGPECDATVDVTVNVT